ncbi:MAG: signal transduction histidine kinase [Herbinix sp.]|jgi:signal transduction histidine kinase|nr:signal transduction histidine kinase [Herbinix sp.]
MLWLVIILLFVIGILIAYILLYKRGIRNIIQKLQFIREHETNMNINLQINYKELNELAKELNYIMNNYKNEKAFITRAQQEFKEELTSISHDLRTPLTSIAGYVQMLESERTSKEKKEEYYAIIRGRIDTLVKMLDELYEFARIESDEYQLHMEKININNVLTDAISLYYYDFVSRGEEPIINIPTKPIYISADKDAITRVFQNLIKNYLTHGAGAISITVREEDKQVYICFKNYAPGLDHEEANKLFNRFYTADKSRTKKTTGLGLAIVKNLVIKMKGRVEAYVENSYLIINIILPKQIELFPYSGGSKS